MTAVYHFRVGSHDCELAIGDYEARLLAYADPTPGHEWKVLSVHSKVTAIARPREQLLSKAQDLLEALERDNVALQYRYGLKVKRPGGRSFMDAGNSHPCLFKETAGVAAAGPGFAHIKVTRVVELQVGSYLETRVLHDLRDMQAAALDDGSTLLARRWSRPVDLRPRIKQLLSFLREHRVPTIECSVGDQIRTGRRPPEGLP
jgi:hypothetical protein